MADFLLEVGTEELPAAFVSSAIRQWQALIPASLSEHFLSSESVNIYGTPRRLAVLVRGLPQGQGDREEEIKGPPAQAAFKDGVPTKSAEGFARKQGVELSALEVRPTDKGDFVFVQKKTAGRPTAEILTALIPEWIGKLEGKRFMRWGDGDLRFSRPIRWLVALLDEAVLAVTIVNGSHQSVHSDRQSRGHRVLHGARQSDDPKTAGDNTVTIARPSTYLDTLRAAFVMADPAERETVIRQQTEAAAQHLNSTAEMPGALVEEVVNLVEWPTAVVGQFEAEFLALPPEVITMVMISHQRYFPLFRAGAQATPDATAATEILLPRFVTISNGDPAKSEIIAEGNGRVVRARLADGEYFYQADAEQPLEALLPKLETVTFQADLGSVAAKVQRIEAIAARIAEQLFEPLKLTEGDRARIHRAAKLCKADLVSQMVFEFPELQGIMGQKYALVGGEDPEVAAALSEHYLPRGAGDGLPQSLAGQVVGIADRLDTLVSIFGLGMIPSGSSDPFALRRAANAIINVTWAANLPLRLDQLLTQTVANFTTAFPSLATSQADLLKQLQEFFLARVRSLLQEEQNIDYDLVNAVLGEGDADYSQRALQDLLDVGDRARFLQTIRQDGRLSNLYEAVNRSSRLAAKGRLNLTELDAQAVVNPEKFQQPTEQALYDGLVALLPKTQAARASRDYNQVVAALAEIAPTVREFFDGDQSVLVMDADPEVQANRLNLLGLLRNHGRVLADFGAIVKGPAD
ncbi:MAG: glycine--tRNA ligase subunit beta [Synechococcales cyanobacterium CRU_2_2]|nr:glycine--tRNA ligase subunit beta [Synechococcales cyanobacterium CRU_2_2]